MALVSVAELMNCLFRFLILTHTLTTSLVWVRVWDGGMFFTIADICWGGPLICCCLGIHSGHAQQLKTLTIPRSTVVVINLHVLKLAYSLQPVLKMKTISLVSIKSEGISSLQLTEVVMLMWFYSKCLLC